MGEIKLEIAVLKSLLMLNNGLPENNNKYWITIEEMRERLIHCGVDRALTTDILRQALKKVNRGEAIMTKRPEGGFEV